MAAEQQEVEPGIEFRRPSETRLRCRVGHVSTNTDVEQEGPASRVLNSLLLSQWAHPRLLPKEETGPPVTRVLLGES